MKSLWKKWIIRSIDLIRTRGRSSARSKSSCTPTTYRHRWTYRMNWIVSGFLSSGPLIRGLEATRSNRARTLTRNGAFSQSTKTACRARAMQKLNWIYSKLHALTISQIRYRSRTNLSTGRNSYPFRKSSPISPNSQSSRLRFWIQKET